MLNDLYLSLTLSRRELEQKYKGSILGVLWIFFNPILLLSLYSFIFQYVFSARWHIENTTTNYTVALFCGLVPFFFITEMMGKGTDLIRGNGNLVKKVVFNKLVLPISSTISSTVILTINISLLLIASYIFNDDFSIFKLTVVLYVLPIALVGFSICTICSCIGVYFRDFTNIVGFINPVLMFTSPIFFSSETISDKFRGFLSINPLTYIIEGLREIILKNNFDLINYFSILIVSLIVLLLSSYAFNRLKDDFSDLI
jgi:lipopolysaccharide transport system permease protein